MQANKTTGQRHKIPELKRDNAGYKSLFKNKNQIKYNKNQTNQNRKTRKEHILNRNSQRPKPPTQNQRPEHKSGVEAAPEPRPDSGLRPGQERSRLGGPRARPRRGPALCADWRAWRPTGAWVSGGCIERRRPRACAPRWRASSAIWTRASAGAHALVWTKGSWFFLSGV